MKRNRQKVKAAVPVSDEADSDSNSETDYESKVQKVTTKKVKLHNDELKDNYLKDFDIQAKKYLDDLETIYKNKLQNIELRYKKLFITIPKEILNCTLAEYIKFKENYGKGQEIQPLEEIEEEEEEVVVQQNPQEEESDEDSGVQSPNVTTSGRTRSRSNSSRGNVNRDIDISPAQNNATFTLNEPVVRPRSTVESLQSNRITRSLAESEINTPNTRTIKPKFNVKTGAVLQRFGKINEIGVSVHGTPLVTAKSVINNVSLTLPRVDGSTVLLVPGKLSAKDIPELSDEVIKQLSEMSETINLIRNHYSKK